MVLELPWALRGCAAALTTCVRGQVQWTFPCAAAELFLPHLGEMLQAQVSASGG